LRKEMIFAQGVERGCSSFLFFSYFSAILSLSLRVEYLSNRSCLL
jgi:hypothetical protein